MKDAGSFVCVFSAVGGIDADPATATVDRAGAIGNTETLYTLSHFCINGCVLLLNGKFASLIVAAGI